MRDLSPEYLVLTYGTKLDLSFPLVEVKFSGH